jgi:hypothetical protein
MRSWKKLAIAATVIPALATLPACAPEVPGDDTGTIASVFGLEPGTGNNDGAAAVTPVDTATDNETSDSTTTETAPVTQISGALGFDGDYQLFQLGSASPGDEWTLTPDGIGLTHSYLVVLFDNNQHLLTRTLISNSRALRHVIRADTNMVWAGVTTGYTNSSGNFTLGVRWRSGQPVPGPTPQVVYVNFNAASNVSVHQRSGISFGNFDAGTLDASYAGHTTEMEQKIVAAMRLDYAAYNVQIVSSVDGPVPTGTHTVIHFGADDTGLLGLADNVDEYNSDPDQTAIVYIEAFADYSIMGLNVDEMSQMIANVGSHELGHLLGLYHTQVVDDIMDTTGTAWDLSREQSFTVAKLESSVFPVGYENAPARLADGVGYNPNAKTLAVSKAPRFDIPGRKQELRAMTHELLHCRCGNCAHPD